MGRPTIEAHIENLERQKASFERIKEARLRTIQREIDLVQKDIDKYEAELARRTDPVLIAEEREAELERKRVRAERARKVYHAKKEAANA